MGATGNHVVTLDGTANQTITMSQAGLFDQHFFDLTVANTTGGIIFASDVAVAGTLTIPAGAGVDGTGFGWSGPCRYRADFLGVPGVNDFVVDLLEWQDPKPIGTPNAPMTLSVCTSAPK